MYYVPGFCNLSNPIKFIKACFGYSFTISLSTFPQ